MTYPHLTDEKRYDIYELRVKGLGVREIAKRIKRDKSTVSKVLRRNHGERGYRPKQALEKVSQRLRRRRGGNRLKKRQGRL